LRNKGLIGSRKSISKALKTHTDEHFQTSTVGVFPTDSDSKIAVLIVANKYSPNNFWYDTAP
jgi:capping protein alpha